MKEYKLGELLEVKHGFAFKKENYVKKSNIALVTLANISETNNFKFNSDKTTYYDGEYPESINLYEGDLIMPLTEQVIGLFGNSAFVPKIENIQFVLNQRVGKVIPNEKLIDKYFLHFLLSTELVRKQLEARANGTKQRNISPNDVYDVTVYIPELEEQKKIGLFLYNIERVINNNNDIIDNINKLLNNIYNYWFCQYKYPHKGEIIYKHDDSLNIDIPDNWQVKTIKDCIDHIKTGLNPRKNFKFKKDGKYNYITVKNLNLDGTIDFLNCDRIDENAKKIVNNRSNLEKGDILFASISPLGRCFLLCDYPDDWDINESVFTIRVNENIVNKEYMYMFLTSEQFIKFAENSSSGSIFKGIRMNVLENTKIIIPDKETLNNFKRITVYLYELKNNSFMENCRLNNSLKSLTTLLLTGQIKIED